MDLRSDLISLQASIMHNIQLAASQQQTQWIMLLGTFATQVEADLAMLSEIEERTRSIKDRLQALPPSMNTEAMRHGLCSIRGLPRSTSVDVTHPSSRKQGMDAAKRARKAFVHTCHTQGIRLLPKQRTIVSTPSGALIALPFARELPDFPDRWFLGVHEGSSPSMCPYACIAFLCQDANERVFHFIVPHKHLQQHWNQFSRGTGGVKFDIYRDGVNFTLRVPGTDPIRLNAYQEAYGNLNGHTL
jgi:hypothetical protein